MMSHCECGVCFLTLTLRMQITNPTKIVKLYFSLATTKIIFTKINQYLTSGVTKHWSQNKKNAVPNSLFEGLDT